MSLGVQAVLLGIVGFLSNAEWFLGTCFIQHPIILGPLTGLIVGDLQAGIIMEERWNLHGQDLRLLALMTRRIR